MEYRHPENFISLWLHSREQNGTRNTTVTWQFICAAVPGAGIRCPPPCCCSRWPRTTTPCPRSETWGAVQHVTSEFQTVQNSKGTCQSKVSPVIRNVEVKVSDVRGVFRKDDVPRELTGSEPEREVWDLVELELSVNPDQKNTWVRS